MKATFCDPPCPPHLCREWSHQGWCELKKTMTHAEFMEQYMQVPVPNFFRSQTASYICELCRQHKYKHVGQALLCPPETTDVS